MKVKTQNILPKTTSEILNGGIYQQRVRCGKSNCRCARGEYHTAFYFITYRNKKMVKIYVRKAEVESFRSLSRRAADERRAKRKNAKRSDELLRQFRQSASEYKSLIKSYKEQNHDDKS